MSTEHCLAEKEHKKKGTNPFLGSYFLQKLLISVVNVLVTAGLLTLPDLQSALTE